MRQKIDTVIMVLNYQNLTFSNFFFLLLPALWRDLEADETLLIL